MQRKIAQALLDHIKTHSFNYGDSPAESVLDFLWLAYFDIQRGDPEDIKQGFRALDKFFEGKTFEDVQYIFDIVCNLCTAYEKRAFIDGLQLGAKLAMELQ